MSLRTDRPRLLVVFYANPDYYPPTFNAVSLLRSHFDVRIVCRKSDRETRLWPSDVRIDRIGPSQTLTESMEARAAEKLREFGAFTWAVSRKLGRYRPDVVLAYEPHAMAALSLAGCKAPIVYQRHEVEDLERFDRASLGGWIGRYALRRSADAALVVFPEATRADYYAAHVELRRPPLVVPNFPLASSFPEPDLDTLLRERECASHLIYRGSLGPANGVIEGIEAMPFLEPRIRLRICGQGSREFCAELQSLVRRHRLDERVELAGFVPFEELNRQTQRASVGLMLYKPIDTNWTHIATANNKTYEYAACGLPVLVPDRASFRDFLGGESWVAFVDESNPRAIASAAERLLSDPAELGRKSRDARKRFLERYNYEEVFGPMLEEMVRLARRP